MTEAAEAPAKKFAAKGRGADRWGMSGRSGAFSRETEVSEAGERFAVEAASADRWGVSGRSGAAPPDCE